MTTKVEHKLSFRFLMEEFEKNSGAFLKTLNYKTINQASGRHFMPNKMQIIPDALARGD
jgi:hypothetical protein